MERYFWNLTDRQSNGMACVLCGADYARMRIPSVEVGRIPDAVESPVYACAHPCAGRIAEEAESTAREMRKAAAEAGAGWQDANSGGDEGHLGADGHFGSLLRDLRALVGTEALLTVSDDLATIRFLLRLVAYHSEEAKLRAVALVERLESGEG